MRSLDFYLKNALLDKHGPFQTSKRAFDERFLLLVMLRVIAGRGRCGSWTSAISPFLARRHPLVSMIFDIEPRALILLFILHPDNFRARGSISNIIYTRG